MKKYLIISIIFFLPILVFGQQDAMFTKYMFNSLVFNPAYAGSQGNWDMNTSFRRQWLGLEGSPTTMLVSAEGAVSNDRIGLGLTVFHDRIGIEQRTDISTNYSYILDLPAGRLLLGIKAGLGHFRFNFSALNADQIDPYYLQTNNPINLYFGPGLLFQNEFFFAGLASPNLLAVDLNSSDLYPAFIKQHFYAQVGGFFSLGESGMQFRPSVLVSFQQAAPVQFHLNAGLLINKFVAAGLSFRSGDAFNVNVTIYPTDNLRFGFGYDFTISKLKDYNDATFEIMLGYSFGEQVTKIDNPR